MLWSLQKAKYLVIGCPNLIISSNNKPLLGILKDKIDTDMDNPRLIKMKEKMFGYKLKSFINVCNF